MIKKIVIASVLLLVLTCAVFAEPIGLLFTAISAPVAATSLTGYEKKGESTSFGILGMVAFGDAGIEAASKKSQITAIQHVDKSCLYILCGLFMMETTKVYGK
jgi:hypothetical protein